MWVFYVNRGQGICSMGIQDKDKPIMEFLPANWAYQLAPSQGFRTFIKFPGHSASSFYEPFQANYRDASQNISQRMIISPSHLVLVEENQSLGLTFTIEYHTVPEDSYAGLIRTLRIENTGNKGISIEGLDGLPLVIPYGLNNFALKHIRRLTEAFVEVSNYDQSAPLFKGKVEPADRPEVVRIEKGNFYVGLEQGEQENRLLKPIVDPQRIFGSHTDYAYPANFIDSSFEDLYEGQVFENRLPAAMSPFQTTLQAGQTYTLTSIIGHIESSEALNSLIPTISSIDYLQNKKRSSQAMIDTLTRQNLIVSGEATLDLYTRQNFLDNVLRGGFPYTLRGKQGCSVLHLYSRKHGDLERDYNDYRITPTNYSQGNGNYRDVNQNRRSDLLFNPDVKSGNLEHFYNLIQLDGFNPLVIKEIRYLAQDKESVSDVLTDYLPENQVSPTLSFLSDSRTPGEVLEFLYQRQVNFQESADEFLGDLLDVCHKIHDTDHGEGYWSDHWTYNLDLLENYLAIYPEQLHYILFEKQSFTFHDSPYQVRAREDKYVIWDNNPMQLESVHFDNQKDVQIKERDHHAKSVRTLNGEGDVYHTFLIIKLLSLITNKMASLDPSGIGVEMESDKPNWYDALNGLPALIGSSLSETMELKRHIVFVQNILEQHPDKYSSLDIFEELLDFILIIQGSLHEGLDAFSFWDQATTAKENFRHQVRMGISGIESHISIVAVAKYLESCLRKLDQGIDLSWDADKKIPSTYFTHSIDEYEIIQRKVSDGSTVPKTNAKGQSCFKAKAFSVHHLPHFLEGPVHYLRCQPEQKAALELVHNIKQSDLYDTKLGMYKVNASLDDEPMEIGRARVFSPGWFENESIWLHMEYKYMYEMLRNGLYDMFFEDFKQVFIPFQKPEVYGRSILENSSFLVSSANPDSKIHGTGFVARLSGATAEYIQILMHMCIGPKPFDLDKHGEVVFQIKPVIPSWLFTTSDQHLQFNPSNDAGSMLIPANSFSFMFLGEIMVTYHNPKMKNTFGSDRVSAKRFSIHDEEGNTHNFEGNHIEGDMALQIRSRRVSRIDVILD